MKFNQKDVVLMLNCSPDHEKLVGICNLVNFVYILIAQNRETYEFFKDFMLYDAPEVLKYRDYLTGIGVAYTLEELFTIQEYVRAMVEHMEATMTEPFPPE